MPESPNQSKLNSSLWEHWLQRLYVGGRLTPSIERERLTLLERLTHLQTHDRRFWIRKANRLKDSFEAPLVLICDQSTPSPTVVYSTLGQAAEQEAVKQLQTRRLFGNKPGVLNYRIRWHFRARDKVLPLGSVATLTVEQPNSGLLSITIATVEPLTRNDLKFLRIVYRLIRTQQEQQALGLALRSETERLTTLTHHLSEGLMILDRNQRVILWNRPLQRLTGYSPKEAQDESVSEVFRTLSSPNWLDELTNDSQVTPLRNVFSLDLEIVTKTRRSRWVNVSGSFLHDDTGEVEQTIVIVRDISRHKELEARKSEFISIATHELRTPITAIKGYLSLLDRQAGSLTEKQRHYLSQASQANDRLVRLAEDLLQVVHVEENRLRFVLRPVSLLALSRKVVSEYKSKAKHKGIGLKILPPSCPTVIAADPVRLEQVVANLVDNAIKYSQNGSVELSYSQAEDDVTKERQVILQIKDEGIGIPEKELPHIFDKFHRCSNGSRSEAGTGLGLFIVKSFMEKQGGNISVRSQLNRGSTFVLSFPAVETQKVERRKNGKKTRSAR